MIIGPFAPWAGARVPVILQAVAGITINPGNVCYLFGSDSVKLAATNLTEVEADGCVIAIDTIADGAFGRFLLPGDIVEGLSGGTPGAAGWLNSVTDGAGIIAAAPDINAGHYLARAGRWRSATKFLFRPEYPVQLGV